MPAKQTSFWSWLTQAGRSSAQQRGRKTLAVLFRQRPSPTRFWTLLRFSFFLVFLGLFHLAGQYHTSLQQTSKYVVGQGVSSGPRGDPSNNTLSLTSATHAGPQTVQAHDLPIPSSRVDEKPRLTLRYDWTNLEPSSDLTKRMVAHQSNCSTPLGTFLYRNRFGLGSDLHIWGQALCNGMQLGMRIRTVGNWTWLDEEHCGGKDSPMLCYFQRSELNCPEDVRSVQEQPYFDAARNLSRANGVVLDFCQDVYRGMDRQQVRISALEYLFARVSPLVVEEAERQLNYVFRGLPEVPKDLITVHIRWGDKGREMKLVAIQDYIQAVHKILDRRQDKIKAPSIYLATEDPAAVREFQDAMPKGWNLYVDQFYEDMLPHRIEGYNGSPKMSKATRGRAGLVALGSLLVAMEANHFVLTTASNWSRLMNELRQSILDSRCNGCTTMTDLRIVRNEW